MTRVKRVTPAAWLRMLRSFEEAYVLLMAEELQPHERDGLYSTHALLRRRAGGEDAKGV